MPNDMGKIITREFDYAVVTAERVKYNATAYDEWVVKVEPKQGGEIYETRELAGLFTNGEQVAERAYRQWIIDNL